jgi:raffinose/stachyose/melibiose transport system substrate-binding protein
VAEWFFGEFTTHVAGPEAVFDALTGEIPWTDPDLVESVSTWTDMVQQGYWMGGVDRFFTATFDEFHAAFGAGEAAMNLEGTWFYSSIPDVFGDNPDDWDWVPVPSSTGEPVFSLGIGSIRGINANSDNPDAAAEWLDHEFSPETQARMLVDCGLAMAPVSGVEESMLSGMDPRIARLFAEFGEAQAEDRYGYTVWTFYSPDSEAYIIEQIQGVLTGDLTVEDYLQGLDEVFSEDLAAGNRPPLPDR